MEDIKDIERRNNETSDLGEKNEIIKHEDDKKCCQNDTENKVKDNENIGKDPEPIDSTPIEIESMSHATHSNMETLADTDFIQDFQQNIKFKLATDNTSKRINTNNDGKDENDSNKLDDNDPENKFFLIKDFHMFSRFTKLFPHLFVNSALDYTTSRPRMITEKEAIDRML